MGDSPHAILAFAFILPPAPFRKNKAELIRRLGLLEGGVSNQILGFRRAQGRKPTAEAYHAPGADQDERFHGWIPAGGNCRNPFASFCQSGRVCQLSQAAAT